MARITNQASNKIRAIPKPLSQVLLFLYQSIHFIPSSNFSALAPKLSQSIFELGVGFLLGKGEDCTFFFHFLNLSCKLVRSDFFKKTAG